MGVNKTVLIFVACLVCLSLVQCSKVPDNRTYKYIFFTEECFEKFFTAKDFTNPECIKLTISKGLGTGIVLFSTILKVPQILKIVKSKSVEGLSFSSAVFETTLYLFTVAYNLFKENPFSLYGENVFIIFQNLIIMALFATYGKQFSTAKLLGTYVLLGALSAPLLLKLVPHQIFEFTLIINFVIFLFSRAPQIYSNFKNKSTGQLSAVTLFLNFAGALARTFTILAEKPDPLVLVGGVSRVLYFLETIKTNQANNFEAVILNGTILAQIILFWNNSSKVKKD